MTGAFPPHPCPGPHCEAQVEYDKLACGPHWHQVPGRLKKAVYRAWANGRGARTKAHEAAIAAAAAEMRPL